MAETYTTIEINENVCKIAQTSRQKERIVIEHLVEIPLPSRGVDEQGETESAVNEKVQVLRKALKLEKIKPVHACLLLPKNQVTTRFITLPSSQKDEIAKMARFESERHIPFNIERHAFSHHIVKIDDIKGSEVLIAAADQAVFDETIQILNGAGIKLDSVDVSTFGLFNYFSFLQRQHVSSTTHTEESGEEHKFSIPLINIGQTTTDITIVQDQKLLFNRSCSVGLNTLIEDIQNNLPETLTVDFTFLKRIDMVELEKSLERSLGSPSTHSPASPTNEAENPETDTDSPRIEIIFEEKKNPKIEKVADIVRNWLSRLLSEIKRTYEFAKREFDCYPTRMLYLAGAGTFLPNIKQFLSINLGVETHIMNPLDHMGLARESITSKISIPSDFVELLGSALRHYIDNGIEINLIPDSYVRQTQEAQKKITLMTHGVMILAIVVFASFYVGQQISYRNRALEWYSQQNKKLKPVVDELIDKDKKLDIIRQHLHDKRSALAILESISTFEFMPDKASLRTFKYLKDGTLELTGHARSIKDMNVFQSALEETDFFASVELKQLTPTRLPGRDTEVYSFMMICQRKNSR